MPFKPPQSSAPQVEKPQELLINPKGEIKGVLDYQSEILDFYLANIKETDIAFELPTGSGKTLIGILLAEFRRVKFNEQVLYLCPTRQLVNQVVEEAESKYGIKAVSFTGKKSDYDKGSLRDYKAGRVIGVTTYSALFNTNPEFNEADFLIFDDAHTADNYFSNYFSLTIDREKNESIYRALVEIIKPLIDGTFYERMLKSKGEVDRYDIDWIDMLPAPKVADQLDKIFQILDFHLTQAKGDVKFGWQVIKDKLHACNFFLSYDEIQIRPYIPPTLSHKPFSLAKQRVYMSATLGLSGELERVTGVQKIFRIPIPSQWKKKVIGRRFFVFPELIMEKEELWNHIPNLLQHTPRALFITKNHFESQGIKNELTPKLPGARFFDGKGLEENQVEFVNSNPGFAIISNRFEGINFPGDECRLLVLHNLSKTTNLQERFMLTRMAVSVIYQERIRTRIAQAAGRCTRGVNDFAVVYIIGSDFTDELLNSKKILGLHPELQAEILFGYEQSSKNVTDATDLLEMIDVFLEHKSAWEQIDAYIRQIRDDKIKNPIEDPNSTALKKVGSAAPYEVKFMYSLWDEDYEEALKYANQVLSNLDGDDVKGYRAYWYYQAGTVCYYLAKQGKEVYAPKFRDYFFRAGASSTGVAWLKSLKDYSSDSNSDELPFNVVSLVEGIEKVLLSLAAGNLKKLEAYITNMERGLAETDGKKFEQGHKLLGKLAGFICDNPSDDAAPDPYFIVSNLCFVFEDKIFTANNPTLSVTQIKQAGGHATWMKEHVPALPQDAEIITCIITNAVGLDEAARTFSKDLYLWPLDDFRAWSKQASSVIRQLAQSFTGQGDANWREQAARLVYNSALDPEKIKQRITQNTVSSFYYS
ncbi:DEAD/DEAH box helicase [Pontibacter oryzae]|uniref:Helicase ATP-binding domain-containing protein n=1 Tax=Pontibacter oryzae TaxID=2304593 RepID=A0A399RVD5_9BACT|nr:DEAD/DEAH box helicase [Pontibacter oryzae]RIJ34274.1 hypothetical protein D1627_15230 [Pontibacter oryzae]